MELVLALLACGLVSLVLGGKTPRQTPPMDEDEAFEEEWEAASREVEAELDDEWLNEEEDAR